MKREGEREREKLKREREHADLRNFPVCSVWSSLVEGDEGSYLSNCQTNLVIAFHTQSLLFRHFINSTAYRLGRYKPSSHDSSRAPRINRLINGSGGGCQM